MKPDTTLLSSQLKIKKKIKKYEETIFSFFRELNLPTKFREIVRAYIVASDGNTIFEASYNDLTNILFKRSPLRFQGNKNRTRSNVRALKKWQQDNGVEIVRILEEGKIRRTSDGSEEYLKTKYELVLLDELVQVIYTCPSQEINKRVKEVVAKMKEINVPEKNKKTPTLFKLQRTRSTLFTLFGKSLEQAKEINLDPIKYGERLLTELNGTFNELAELLTEKQNRERRISEFMGATNLAEINSYENEGVADSHTHSLGNSDQNLPSDKRIPPVYTSSEIDLDIDFLSSEISENTDSQLLNAALNYAKAGYPVVPLHTPVFENRCSCRDWKTCEKPGKHPRTWHGLKDATTNLETVKFWWRKWPNANIGLLTGKRSNVFVLDVDPKSGGLYSLEEFQDSYCQLPATLTAISGSGGRHLIFKYPDVRIKNSASLIARGLDIKSDNGYIVAAPSLHISGERYQWHGVNTPILDAPDWLIAVILLAEEEVKQDNQTISEDGLGISPPLISNEPIKEHEGRNTYLFNQARGLVNSYSPEEVKKRIQAKNLARCVPPVDDGELEGILKSAESYRHKLNKKAA
jgi:bifunctional DNA primase/polymerase-like protein